jgi:hypothetical protein
MFCQLRQRQDISSELQSIFFHPILGKDYVLNINEKEFSSSPSHQVEKVFNEQNKQMRHEFIILVIHTKKKINHQGSNSYLSVHMGSSSRLPTSLS